MIIIVVVVVMLTKTSHITLLSYSYKQSVFYGYMCGEICTHL